jgi:hypothetical protein
MYSIFHFAYVDFILIFQRRFLTDNSFLRKEKMQYIQLVLNVNE